MKKAAEFYQALTSAASRYTRRFVPTVAMRISRSHERLPRVMDVPLDGAMKQLKEVCGVLNEVFPAPDYHLTISQQHQQTAHERIREILGFSLERRQSSIAGAGSGVFVKDGTVKEHSLAAVYPGTLHDPCDASLLASINNSFMLLCQDGMLLDASDRGLSKLIHKGCARRDTEPLLSDLSWLEGSGAINFLNHGHYINNCTKQMPQNVQYMEANIDEWPADVRRFLPIVSFSQHEQIYPLRVVLLTSLNQINAGEELFSSYISLLH